MNKLILGHFLNNKKIYFEQPRVWLKRHCNSFANPQAISKITPEPIQTAPFALHRIIVHTPFFFTEMWDFCVGEMWGFF